MRTAFWSTCKLGKGGSSYWVAYTAGSPIEDPTREPDAKGKATSEKSAEVAARATIKAVQVDWRCTVARTLDRFAEMQAVIEGLKVYSPPPRWEKMRAEQTERFAERDRIKAAVDAFNAEIDAFNKAREAWRENRGPIDFRPASPSDAAFALLGLPRSASAEDVKRAFRAKAYVVHPDRGGDHQEFCALNAAWRTATDAANGVFRVVI